MVKRIAVLLVVAVLGLALAADAGQGTGRIAGTARNAQNEALSNVKAQLRNVDTGQIVATRQTGNDGNYEFTGLNAGTYVVEIVDSSGKIVGLSPSLALAAGGTIAGVAVVATAAGSLAGATAAGGLGTFFASKGGILLLAGVGAGAVAGIIALTNNEASPSR